MTPTTPVSRIVYRDGRFGPTAPRVVAEEVAVAFTYDRATTAVTMATPADLEDLAVGWSLTEGVIDSVAEIEELEIVDRPLGFECRMSLVTSRAEALQRRQRRRAGATGCGLCGIESLEEAMRAPAPVGSGRCFAPNAIAAAVAMLPAAQALNAATHAVHAAAFWEPSAGLVATREDVGRHNALDKLIGALMRAGRSAGNGVVLLSSRVSIEMVQKTARAGTPVLVAVSAPTAEAVRMAEAAGITLIAVARSDGFEVFTHGGRIVTKAAHHAA
jgi:FdhD protein